MKTQAILTILLIAKANSVVADYCPVIPPMSGSQQTSPATHSSLPPWTSQPTNTVHTPDTPDMSDALPTSTASYVPVTYPVDVSSARSHPMSVSYTTRHSTTTNSVYSSHAADATDSASVIVEIGWSIWAMSLIFASFVAAGFGVGIAL